MARFAWIGAFGFGLSIFLPAQQNQAPESPAVQPAAPAQDSPALIPRSHEERERSYLAQHRIILNVLVTDAKGRPATGLTQGDFALLDNREAQKIASFRVATGHSERERVHVVLMLDSVNDSAKTIGFERRGIEKYLSQNRGKLTYPISIGMLSASGAKVLPPSLDADVLIGELGQLMHEAHPVDCGEDADGATGRFDMPLSRSDALSPRETTTAQSREADCLNRRFIVSVTALNKLAMNQIDVPGRAIVIWLGAGWPLLTNPIFRADTTSLKRRYYDYLADVFENLQQGQVTVDAVASPDVLRSAGLLLDDYHKASLISSPTTDQASPANMSLPILAYQTGGQILDSKDLNAEIAASVADAESYYVLSFDAPPAAGVGEYHALEVKVNKPGLKVRTNTAYFAQP
jgi:VWFA-related protein